MRNKAGYFVLTVIIALTAWFAARQQTLNELRAGNDSLRRQIADIESVSSAGKPGGPPANPATDLTEADERELLQLRSKMVPLWKQLRDTSNRVVLLQRGGQSLH
jgi:hypothetical protein